jgi:uncharacterized repeat protein (TIGR03803 family)
VPTPDAGLVEGSDGNFYGTTPYGANLDCGSSGCGTVFDITSTGTFTTLYEFDAAYGGIFPYSALLQSTNGVFYATTYEGGFSGGCDSGCGVLYSLNMGLGPFVSFVRNPAKVGQLFGILGQGFTGTTSVLLNGTSATFTVKSDTLIEATVPSGATTGYVTVTTPSGTLTSNVPFQVIP